MKDMDGSLRQKEEGINRIVLSKDSHHRAYVFSSYNDKVRASVVSGTTRTKEGDFK